MAKIKRKLTPREKAEKKRRKREFMTIFIHGKQKRVRRPETIEGMSVEDFIRANADPIWLHQDEAWEWMDVDVDMDVNEADAVAMESAAPLDITRNRRGPGSSG